MNKVKTLAENCFYFSSESVTEGNPDKLCDSISDCILDAYLIQDKDAKVNITTLAKSNMVMKNKILK